MQGDQAEKGFHWLLTGHTVRKGHNSDPKHGTKRTSLSLEEVNLGQMKDFPASHSRTGFREFVPQ